VSINIIYFQKETPKKIQKIKPVSSVLKVHHSPSKKQGRDAKNRDQYSEFQEILDSAIEECEKGIQKRK